MNQKPTLLDIVKIVLNDLNGDAVNSISDTEESEEVAKHVESVYRNLVSHTEWPHTRRAVTLVPYSNNLYPTHMRVSEEYKKLVFVNYNVSKVNQPKRAYRKVEWLEPEYFLHKINQRDDTSAFTDTIIDPSGIELFIANNKAPDYFTSFDDVTLIFDGYDNQVDSTLQSSKVQAVAYIIPRFVIEDTFVPDLPAEAFAYLIEETISRCQFKMRQIQDIKSENEATKQSRWLSQSNFVVKGGVTFPDYGKSRYGRRKLHARV